ncbi:MAG: ECF transporter S component [Eubacterium sp.]|jgi:riboflavin transporter FmnP
MESQIQSTTQAAAQRSREPQAAARPLGARKRKTLDLRSVILIAMFGAVSMVLMYFDFATPIAPGFIKFDFADLPAMLATFMLGPVQGLIVCALKLALKLLIKGSETAFVGEAANFICGACYMLPAALIYHFKKGKKWAAISLVVGTLSVTVCSVFMNTYVMFPLFSKLYGMPMEAIIGAGTALNPHITDMTTMMLYSVVPFNLVKYGIVSFLTFILYKRMKRLLIRR